MDMKTGLFTLLFLVAFKASLAQRDSLALPRLFDTIYTKPMVQASYPGGDSGWRAYVKKHVKYPRKAWWDEVETEITVGLVINKNGVVESAQHLNITGYGFEQEAVRLVMKSGKWKPATHNGQPVKSEGQLKVEFRLK
jgi:TonB family protein